MVPYIVLAATAGFFIPLQALINARLAGFLAGPISASVASFTVGLLCLIAFHLAGGYPLPWVGQAIKAPWYAWCGGALGAVFVASTAIAVVKLGTASMVSIVIAAQLVGAMLLDHFGVLHPAHPISLARVLGALFLLFGVYLIVQPKT